MRIQIIRHRVAVDLLRFALAAPEAPPVAPQAAARLASAQRVLRATAHHALADILPDVHLTADVAEVAVADVETKALTSTRISL